MGLTRPLAGDSSYDAVFPAFGVGVLQMSVPTRVSGPDLTAAVLLAGPLAVPAPGAADELLVPEGDALGVADAVLLGVADGVAVALGVEDGVLLGAAAGLQFVVAAAEEDGVALGAGRLGLVPLCSGPGLPRPVTPPRTCWWPGEVTELVGANIVGCIRFSDRTPTTTTATTAATANAGLSQAAAGPRRGAVLPAGVELMRWAPAGD